MRNIIVICTTLIAIGVLASEELPIGEITPIGEVGGVTYLAMPHEPGPAGTSFEIRTETGNVYETITEVTVPAADRYYAGVSPEGEYYFVAGETESDASYGNTVKFLYVYQNGKDDPLNVDIDEFIGYYDGLGWSGGKLYTVAIVGPGGVFPGTGATLYETDPAAGTIEEILSAYSIELPGEGGRYVYYTELGPDNSLTVNKLTEGTPLYETWLHGRYKFEPRQPLYGIENLGFTIPCRMDLTTGVAEKLFEATATSTLTEPGKPADNLGPEKAIDGDLSTAWVEGVDGPGVGETLTITFGAAIEVNFIDVIPGFGKDPRVYYGNNRVKKVRLEFSDGTKITETFDDEVGLRSIDCYDNSTDSGIEAEWLKITMLEVHEGLEWDDTGISEVAINPY